MPATPQALPRRIVQARDDKGWSQKRAAEVIGISYATLNRIERGHHRPNTETAKKIAIALDIDVPLTDTHAKRLALEDRVTTLELQVNTLIDEVAGELLDRVEGLERKKVHDPQEARDLIAQLTRAHSREEIMEWVANTQEGAIEASHGRASGPRRPEPQRA